MKKNIFPVVLLLSFAQVAFSQIQIVPGGDVVMGRPLDPTSWVLVGESVANFPIISGTPGKLNVKSYNTPGLIIDYKNSSADANIWPTASITRGNKINAKNWVSMYGNSHNAFTTCMGCTYAKCYISMSDGTYKTDVNNIDDALSKVLALRGVTYKFTASAYCGDDCSDEIDEFVATEPRHYGFISQEVEPIIPEIVKTVQAPNAVKGLNYIEIIPLLVESIKAQEARINTQEVRINTQETRINMLQSALASCCPVTVAKSGNTSNSSQVNDIDHMQPASLDKMQHVTLDQNIPNPSHANTTINYETPDNIGSVSIFIYDMQGKQIRSYKDLKNGKSSISVRANELSPGMYLYSLIVNGEEVNTKKMIIFE